MSAAWLELHTVLAQRLDAREAYRLMHNYRDEELRKHAATTPTANEAYPGQLAMLSGLVATLRAVAQHGDLADVQKLLAEHERDEQDAYAESQENGSPAGAGATPDKVTAREARLAQLLDAIRAHGGKWSTRQVQEIRRVNHGPTQRGTARRDLAELHRRGHLAQHGAGDGRYYTLRRQGGDQ